MNFRQFIDLSTLLHTHTCMRIYTYTYTYKNVNSIRRRVQKKKKKKCVWKPRGYMKEKNKRKKEIASEGYSEEIKENLRG